MRIVRRLIFLIFFISPIVLALLPPYQSPDIKVFALGDWLMLFWGLAIVFSLFSIPIFTFRHWGLSQFKDVETKKKWFRILLIGSAFYLLGPLLYYIIVVELHKGGIKEADESKSAKGDKGVDYYPRG